MALPGDLFDGIVNMPVLHQAVKAFLANQRQGNAATKTRGNVIGGNQKPWKQKGTGRARQGSIRAPHWVGGGTVFGPIPRSYAQFVPQQVRALARKSAFNARAREGAVIVIDTFNYDAPKTSRLAPSSTALGVTDQKVLILTDGVKSNLHLCGRNLPTVHVHAVLRRLGLPHPLVGCRGDRRQRDRADARADCRHGAGAAREGTEARGCAEREPAKKKAAAKKSAPKKAAAEKAPRRRRLRSRRRRKPRRSRPRKPPRRSPRRSQRRRGSKRCRHYIDTIVRPIVTEQSSAAYQERGEYTFQVHPDATKPHIRHAIEQLFAVHVTGVWTSNQRGKAKRMGKTAGRKAHWKKAVVTLREGETIDTIDIFEG